MKIEGKKDIASERLRGRAAIDAVMLPKIAAVMGPKFALYQAKAHEAEYSFERGSPLVTENEASDVRDKFKALLCSIASIESERQTIQARIDAATTASEIDAIIASL